MRCNLVIKLEMDGSGHDSVLTLREAARALDLLSENNLETLSVTLLRISDNDTISTERDWQCWVLLFWISDLVRTSEELSLEKSEVAALMNLVATDTAVDEAKTLIPSLSRFPEAAIDEILSFADLVEHKIWKPYFHWSHLGLEAQYWGGWDDSRKQGSRLDAHSIFCMKFFEGSYYGFAYLIVISCYIPSKKNSKFRWGNCRVDFYFAWSSNFANGFW